MASRPSRGRRVLGRLRRGRLRGDREAETPNQLALPPTRPPSSGWDYTVRAPAEPRPQSAASEKPSLRAEILSLFSDPRVQALTATTLVNKLAAPRQDVEITLAAMLQAGELIHDREGDATRFRVPPLAKRELEAMFRDAAVELGEITVLAHPREDALAAIEEDGEEPRLPVTAGLLSLFLPGTGQLLNGDVGRASLVFAVWSLAWITHLSPVWTFVCLYAGAEAFFTAKIRSMERKMAKEALPGGGTGPTPLPPPKPTT